MELGQDSQTLDEPLILPRFADRDTHDGRSLRKTMSDGFRRASHFFSVSDRPEDQKPRLSFEARTVAVQENHGQVEITVCRDYDAMPDACAIKYQTGDVSEYKARQGFEYSAAAGVLHFAWGQASAKFSVRITDEHTAFKQDCFKVWLSAADDNTAAVGDTGVCIVWIHDRHTRRSLVHRIYHSTAIQAVVCLLTLAAVFVPLGLLIWIEHLPAEVKLHVFACVKLVQSVGGPEFRASMVCHSVGAHCPYWHQVLGHLCV